MPNDPVGEALARAPLLGRETEWQALREAWGAVVGGAERVVVVEGEPGIGRTRLLDDLARLIVAARGSMVRLRLGESDASVPHGATARLVRATLDLPAVSGTAGQWLAELARLVPELRDRFPGIPVVEPASASVGSWRLFEAVGQLLGALAAERPVAILVDDLHWCDAESAAVLATLAGRGRVSRLLWAVTLSAGAAEHDAPGPRLAGALTTGAGGRRVRLRRLDGGEVARLVVSLGVPAPTDGASERLRALAAAVHAESEGVPGLVAGLLRAARACGALHGDAVGGWDAPDGATGLPADLPASLRGVRGAIAARVDRLPDDAREVLGTLALAELPCDLDLLSRMHGMSRLRVASIGDGLVARGLARETEGGYACAHRLVAGVVGERASALWRREAHRALAQLLAQRHPAPVPGTIARAVARHAAAGGDDVLARRYASDVPAVIADVGALGWAPRRPLATRQASERAARGRRPTRRAERRSRIALVFRGRSSDPCPRAGRAVSSFAAGRRPPIARASLRSCRPHHRSRHAPHHVPNHAPSGVPHLSPRHASAAPGARRRPGARHARRPPRRGAVRQAQGPRQGRRAWARSRRRPSSRPSRSWASARARRPTAAGMSAGAGGAPTFTDEVLEITEARMAALLRGMDAEVAARPAAERRFAAAQANRAEAERTYPARQAEYERRRWTWKKALERQEACEAPVRARYEKTAEQESKRSEALGERMEDEMSDAKQARLESLADRMKAAEKRGDQAAVRAIADSVQREMQTFVAMGQEGMQASKRLEATGEAMKAELARCPNPGPEPKAPESPQHVGTEQAVAEVEQAAAKASGLTAYQYAVMKERVEAYVAFLKRRPNARPRGFTAGELAALDGARSTLQQHTLLTEGAAWYPGRGRGA
jgi:hypothetical protein